MESEVVEHFPELDDKVEHERSDLASKSSAAYSPSRSSDSITIPNMVNRMRLVENDFPYEHGGVEHNVRMTDHTTSDNGMQTKIDNVTAK